MGIKKYWNTFLGTGTAPNDTSGKDSLLNRSPKQIMSEIYSKKKWGGKKHDFYSGFGSHSNKVVKPYVKLIKNFLDEKSNSLSVCDLGCGDFNIGSQLVESSKQYFAVDLVEELIVRNQERFKHDKLHFDCVNIIEDDLPVADCALVRQVLQHLSNAHIQQVLPKLKNFKYLFITEHLPKNKFVPNLDKTTGANTRLSRGSGVVLHDAPFNLDAKNRQELLRIRYNKGIIVTTFYEF